jgi:hypothetical protein
LLDYEDYLMATDPRIEARIGGEIEGRNRSF